MAITSYVDKHFAYFLNLCIFLLLQFLSTIYVLQYTVLYDYLIGYGDPSEFLNNHLYDLEVKSLA